MQKTKKEIVLETIQYYRENPRAIRKIGDYVRCHYYDDGKMCAVGRCLVAPEEAEMTAETNCDGDTAVDNLTRFIELDSALKPEYRGHDLAFWRNLQYLHDRSQYWKDNELNKDGKEFVLKAFGLKV